MKNEKEKSLEIAFEDWNALADSTVIQIRGLKLQLRIAEGILHQARMNRDNLRPKEEKNMAQNGSRKFTKTPDTATGDVKTHAKQI